ncbi:MAG: DUF2062 domain-containing protein [Terrimicrobiaceae bacterium]
MFQKLAAHFLSLREKLLALQDAPHALAGGVAIGMFIGFTPLFGLKTLLCLGLAWLLRCNPIAAVIAVTLHDVVTPFWPVILEVEYKIGWGFLRWIHEAPPEFHAMQFHIHEVMQWTTFFTIGLPLLVGSMFLSAPAAFIAYLLTLPVFRRRERRRLSLKINPTGGPDRAALRQTSDRSPRGR